MNKRKLTLYPSEALYEHLERLAGEERRSLNQATLLLIERALTERGQEATPPSPSPEPTAGSPRSVSAPPESFPPAGVAHLQTQGLTPDREQAHKRCPMAFRHHNHHRGNPCPRCGFPE